MTKIEYKAQTWNGNLVIGYGSTLDAARKDAAKKAEVVGSVIKKRISFRKIAA